MKGGCGRGVGVRCGGGVWCGGFMGFEVRWGMRCGWGVGVRCGCGGVWG